MSGRTRRNKSAATTGERTAAVQHRKKYLLFTLATFAASSHKSCLPRRRQTDTTARRLGTSNLIPENDSPPFHCIRLSCPAWKRGLWPSTFRFPPRERTHPTPVFRRRARHDLRAY